MPIGLVPHIPHKLIIRRIEDIMHGHCHFYNPKAGTEMAAINGNNINNVLPQFLANLRQLLNGQFFEIVGGIYFSEKLAGFYIKRHSESIYFVSILLTYK